VSGDGVEQIGVDPLVVAGPDGRVGHNVPAQSFGVDPRASGDQPDQHDLETGSVIDPWTVTAFGVVVDVGWDVVGDCGPHGINHFEI
ncbi:MAG: hypothetical protein WAX05_13565, partial [Candidatus Microthrix parvicella]